MDLNSFFANLLELWGANEFPNTNEFYDFGIFGTLGWILLLFPLFAVSIFYYAMNSPKYNKVKHWLFMGLGISLLISIVSIFVSLNAFRYQGYELEEPLKVYLHLFLSVLVIAFIFFFLYSSLLKWWSRNVSKNPLLTLFL